MGSLAGSAASRPDHQQFAGLTVVKKILPVNLNQVFIVRIIP
jgi:hypothetical protein